jgi:hypothetical protein
MKKSTTSKKTRQQNKRLANCINSQMEILTPRESLISSEGYHKWCASNRVPHLRVEHKKNWSYVSMDLPNAPRGASAYHKHLEVFDRLCGKYGIVPTGCFSVLEVPKHDAIRFSKELFQIGVALYAECDSEK